MNRRQRDEIVRRHFALGLPVDKAPLSAAPRDEDEEVELVWLGLDDSPFSWEAESWVDDEGFAQIEEWLGEADALFLGRDKGEPLVLIPWRTWARIVRRLRP